MFSILPAILIPESYGINFFSEKITFIFILWILTISLTCQLGDLFISYIKRLANVKDTGRFLPGHGGVLDRIDGILFGVPTAFIFGFLNIY